MKLTKSQKSALQDMVELGGTCGPSCGRYVKTYNALEERGLIRCIAYRKWTITTKGRETAANLK